MRKFSSGPIQNEVLTINSEHPYSKYQFERKFQGNRYPYNQSFEQPEEVLTPLAKSDLDKIHSDFGKFHTDMKSMKYNIAAMVVKLYDTSAKTNEQHCKITEFSFKQIEIIPNELLTITSEHPSSKDNFESKFQAKLSP